MDEVMAEDYGKQSEYVDGGGIDRGRRQLGDRKQTVMSSSSAGWQSRNGGEYGWVCRSGRKEADEDERGRGR